MKFIFKLCLITIALFSSGYSYAQSATDQLKKFRTDAGLTEKFELPLSSSVLPKDYQPLAIGDHDNNYACVGESLSNLFSLKMSIKTNQTVTTQTNDINLTAVAITNLFFDQKIPGDNTNQQNIALINQEKISTQKEFKDGNYKGAVPYFALFAYKNFIIPINVQVGNSSSKVFLKSFVQFPSLDATQSCPLMRSLYNVGTIDGTTLSCNDFLQAYQENNGWKLKLKNSTQIIQTLKQLLAEKKISIIATLKTDAYETDPQTLVLSGFVKGSIRHMINIVDYDQNYFYVFDSWSDKKLKHYEGGNRIYKIAPDTLTKVFLEFVVVTDLEK